MEYIDSIYGKNEIVEPVLLDLIQSRAVQRLHIVLQHGITGLIGVTRATTRFEHSMGVMLLARRLGAGLDEQIAALLHDVSHTAFSHVIDYVFNSHESQGYHEEKKEWYMSSSDLPDVLSRHGYDWRQFLHEEDYPILEQPSPALCADRLDYFLRDSYDLKLAPLDQIQAALDHLILLDGRIATDNLETARWLAYNFIAADKVSWANFREVALYELAAQAIRYALKEGILNEADLWSGDVQAWAKMQAAPDAEMQALLRPVSTQTRFEWDEGKPDFWVSTKIRSIDPDVQVDGRLHTLSGLDADFAHFREEYIRSRFGKWPVRVNE